MYIVNQLTTKDEKAELMKTFQSLDKNGDGVLSKTELMEGYKKTMNEAEAEEEVNKIMAQVDKNNSGEIDYSGNCKFELQNSWLPLSTDRMFYPNKDWILPSRPLIRQEINII